MKHLLLSSLLAAATALHAFAAAPAVTPLGSSAGTYLAPARVATDTAGNAFIVDPLAGQITVVDAFNRVTMVKEGLAEPLAIAADTAGRRYVGESRLGSVTVFSPEWNPLGRLGAGTNEFQLPGYVALDAAPDGLLVYVSDGPAHEIKVYREGALLRRFGSLGNGSGQFNFPAGLWVSPAGELYAVDQNNDRVQVFDRAGTFLRSFTLRPSGWTGKSGRAQGIVGDAQGRLYVADTFQGFVKVFTATGGFLGYVGGYGDATGQVLSPCGLALDNTGRLLVASANTARVEAFGLDCFTQLRITPASQFAAVGSTVTFTVEAGCAGPFTYQWRKGTNDLADGGVISGAMTPALTLTGLTEADAGGYSVVVTSTNGAITSPEATLRVTGPPIITQSGPELRNVVRGSVLELAVVATGAGLDYQWYFGGMALPGQSRSALAISNVPPSATGRYYAVVANVAGRATGVVTTVTVLMPPEFLVLPASQTVAERATVTFSALALGGEPLRYQWLRNGVVVANQTNATLVLTNASPAMNGTIVARAYNNYGTTNSPAALLTVLPDTNAPVAGFADGGRFTNRTVLISFSEPLLAATAQRPSNYQIFGPGNLIVLSAVLQNSTNVLLTLSGPRVPNTNYAVRITGVTDAALRPNVIAPNPTTLPIVATVDLIGINSQSWKYLQTNTAFLDSQPWKTPAYNDGDWTNGLGIFYGHFSNNITQPNPNPNVRLPFALSTTDTNNTKVYTVLNVFTNVGGTIREITYYFRTAFVFPGETAGAVLRLRTMVDDGAVVYLNGVEKTRVRMAAAPTAIYYSSLANASGSQNWEPAITNAGNQITLAGLVKGTNVVAVEVHQNSTTSNDITLGLQLEAGIPTFSSAAPVVAITRNLEGGLVLSWTDPFYVLEVADSLAGPWQIAATASPHLVPANLVGLDPQHFFRLRRQ